MLTAGTFYKAIEPVMREHWGLWSKEDEPDAKRCLDSYMNVEETDEPIMDIQEWGGPGVATYKPEGSRIIADQIFQGVGKRFVAQTYASALELTYEAVEDAKKNLPAIISAARSLGESAWKTPDYLAAMFLDRAFNVNYAAFGNGTPLCSTAQVLPRGGTYANAFSGAGFPISETGIEQIITNLAVMPNSAGMIGPLELKKIVAHPNQIPAAWKLAKTERKVGTNYNDLSFVYGNFDVVSNPFLGSTTRWFGLTNVHDSGDGLNWRWRVKPQFLDDNVPMATNRAYIMRFRAYWFAKNPRGIYGSNST